MLENTRLFVKVVQFGSFSKAARVLKVPKSTLSRSIRALEHQVGTVLLLRTTRSLSLTASGRAYFETCLGPIQILEQAEKSLDGSDSIISGAIKITAPEDLGTRVLSPVIAQLLQHHPNLVFEINYSNEVVDLVREGYDLAIRIGKLNASRFKVRKVGVVALVLVASPDYLKQFGSPKNIDELSQHRILSLRMDGQGLRWQLVSGKQKREVPVRPSVTCNHMSALLAMAQSGSGIALVPAYLCRQAFLEKLLIHILPDWRQQQHQVSMVIPAQGPLSARLKVCVEAFHQALTEVL